MYIIRATITGVYHVKKGVESKQGNWRTAVLGWLALITAVRKLSLKWQGQCKWTIDFTLGRLVWFVVDEYYCSETTTAQTCLWYVSLGCCRAAIHNTDESRSAQNSCPLFAWFALCTPYFHVHVHVYVHVQSGLSPCEYS